MGAQVISVEGGVVKVELTIDLADTMLACEEGILAALNEAGTLATEQALKRFDADGQPVLVGGEKWYSKGRQPKWYQTPFGEVEVQRHVYQKSGGGKTLCPLEQNARIVLSSTPRFAKMVAHKFANMSSSDAREDLLENHGRKVARSTLQNLSELVGAVVQAKEEAWEYELPKLDGEVATVAVGTDGTCTLMCEDGWREAMTGTLSLYDSEGERLHTIYVGAAPEYGKGKFFEKMEREIGRLKTRFATARFVGIADGAKANWDFLAPHVDTQILDFYHAAQYVAGAAPAAAPTHPEARRTWMSEWRHKLKHEAGSATALLDELQAFSGKGLVKSEKEDLKSAVTYFSNHRDRMDYARYRAEHLPIGSGVTEAACKTLIKQRLCNAGMRWKNTGAAVVISLRALVLSGSRWEQFWRRVDQTGFPIAA